MMKILEKARQLEARLSRTFSDAAQRVAQTGAQDPLEIVHAIVDAVEQEVQPAGRGAHVFPFNRIKVSVVAASRDTRARLEAVIDQTPTLADRVIDRLRSAGCNPSGVTVRVIYVAHAEARWSNPAFHLDLARQTAPAVADVPPLSQPTLALAIVSGTTDKSEYAFAQPRIELGRCAEVRDARNRLIRTNHVAFADGAGGINESVSRRHAHILYTDREYRVYDDRSAHGTCVVRNSTTLAVPWSSRGIRLQSGDEIVLGEARVRVAISPEPS